MPPAKRAPCKCGHPDQDHSDADRRLWLAAPDLLEAIGKAHRAMMDRATVNEKDQAYLAVRALAAQFGVGGFAKAEGR